MSRSAQEPSQRSKCVARTCERAIEPRRAKPRWVRQSWVRQSWVRQSWVRQSWAMGLSVSFALIIVGCADEKKKAALPIDGAVADADVADGGVAGPRVRPRIEVPSVLDVLGGGPNSHRGSGRMVLGSTGHRLWAISLEDDLGMVGEFNFIHEEGLGGSNLGTRLLEVTLSSGAGLLTPSYAAAHVYRPDSSHRDGRLDDAVTFRDHKFITDDDCGIERIDLRNDTDATAALTLAVTGQLMTGTRPMVGPPSLGRETPMLVGEATFHGVPSRFAFAGTASSGDAGSRHLAPGTRVVTQNLALNRAGTGLPSPSASYTFSGDSVWEAVDGSHDSDSRWTCWSSGHDEDWLRLDFGETVAIDRIDVDIYEDRARGGQVWAPTTITLEALGTTGDFEMVADTVAAPAVPAAGINQITFPEIRTNTIRLRFTNAGPGICSGVVELEAYPGREVEESVLASDIEVSAGGTTDVTLAFCIGTSEEDPAGTLASWLDQEDPVATQRERYGTWFAQHVPGFVSSDPRLDEMWLYRFFVMRYNLAEIGTGLLEHPAFYEGRQYYSRVIPYSTPHILDETRWLRTPDYAFGHLENLLSHQFEGTDGRFDGQLPYLFVNRRSDFWFINWTTAAAWGLQKVHPRSDFAETIGPRLERNVRGMLAHHDGDHDFLPKLGAADGAFYATGMEYQPSFYAFEGDMGLDPERYPNIERVDFASYLYANARAVAEVAAARGDAVTQQEFEEMATAIQNAVLTKMWREEDHFFYDLREEDDVVAEVREVVGFYPFAFDLPPANEREYLAIFDYLTDEAEFWTNHPVATISQQSRFFSQTVPGGCCHWNGPSWPFSTSVVLEALANAAKRYDDPGLAGTFSTLLREFTAQMHDDETSPDHPEGNPEVSESMNGASGQWKSTVENYFHSKYIDLVVRHVGGLTPRSDDILELSPIDIGLTYFAFVGLRYHGHDLDIVWDAPDAEDHFDDGFEGLAVYADGELLFAHPRLAHLLFAGEGAGPEEVPAPSAP